VGEELGCFRVDVSPRLDIMSARYLDLTEIAFRGVAVK
jgi:hypothetical protein